MSIPNQEYSPAHVSSATYCPQTNIVTVVLLQDEVPKDEPPDGTIMYSIESSVTLTHQFFFQAAPKFEKILLDFDLREGVSLTLELYSKKINGDVHRISQWVFKRAPETLRLKMSGQVCYFLRVDEDGEDDEPLAYGVRRSRTVFNYGLRFVPGEKNERFRLAQKVRREKRRAGQGVTE